MVNYFNQITPFNLGASLQSGAQARGQQITNQANLAKMKAAGELSTLEKQVLSSGGKVSPALRSKYIGAAGPDRANKLFDLQEEIENRGAQALARPAMAIRDAPDKMKPLVYEEQLQQLRAEGHDVSKFPPNYEGNEASIDYQLDQIIDRARDFEEVAKEPPAPPASGVKEYMIPGTSETRQFDLTNPTDRAELTATGSPWVLAPKREEVGGPGAFSGSKKQKEALVEKEILTGQAMSTADDIKKTLKDTPGVMSDITTFILKPLKRLSVDAEDAARAIGIDVTASYDKADYKDVLSTIDIRSRDRAGIESAIVNLAFTAALASGQSGKSVSDRDVKRFLTEIGAGQIDDGNFAFVLDKFTDRLQRNYRIRHKAFYKKEYEGDFGVTVGKPKRVEPTQPTSEEDPLGLF